MSTTATMNITNDHQKRIWFSEEGKILSYEIKQEDSSYYNVYLPGHEFVGTVYAYDERDKGMFLPASNHPFATRFSINGNLSSSDINKANDQMYQETADSDMENISEIRDLLKQLKIQQRQDIESKNQLIIHSYALYETHGERAIKALRDQDFKLLYQLVINVEYPTIQSVKTRVIHELGIQSYHKIKKDLPAMIKLNGGVKNVLLMENKQLENMIKTYKTQEFER